MATVVDPIYQGQDVQAQMTCIDASGAAANPTSVRFKIRDPQGTTTTYNSGDPAVTVIEAGKVFGCRFDTAFAGKYRVRTESLDGAGAVVGVDQFEFWVNATNQ